MVAKGSAKKAAAATKKEVKKVEQPAAEVTPIKERIYQNMTRTDVKIVKNFSRCCVLSYK